MVPITDFFADAAAGTLPNYCLVEPNYGTQSEENPQNIVAGEAFVASVVSAVMSGPVTPQQRPMPAVSPRTYYSASANPWSPSHSAPTASARPAVHRS